MPAPQRTRVRWGAAASGETSTRRRRVGSARLAGRQHLDRLGDAAGTGLRGLGTLDTYDVHLTDAARQAIEERTRGRHGVECRGEISRQLQRPWTDLELQGDIDLVTDRDARGATVLVAEADEVWPPMTATVLEYVYDPTVTVTGGR